MTDAELKNIKKAIKKINNACDGMTELGYEGFYMFCKRGEVVSVFGKTELSADDFARMVAGMLVYIPSKFETTKELLFAKVCGYYDCFKEEKDAD